MVLNMILAFSLFSSPLLSRQADSIKATQTELIVKKWVLQSQGFESNMQNQSSLTVLEIQPNNIYLNYNEVYLNDLPCGGYGILTTYLVGATTTVNGTNSLVLDYIKMVPILN